MLVVISGLPGVGKSTVAKALAGAIEAAYLRVDTIEQAMADCGFDFKAHGGAGYHVMARIARENLRLGQNVIVECVNPWPLTREMWQLAAREAGSTILEVELVCSDPAEHRRRVESRTSDVEGLRLPTWQEVAERDYRPWDVAPLQIDTSTVGPDEAVQTILRGITRRTEPPDEFAGAAD